MAIIGTQPFNKSVAITKSDTINFDGTTFSSQPATESLPCDAIYIGTAGVAVVIFEDGTSAAFTCIAGQVLPFKAIRVNSTATTAAGMFACYLV